MQHPIVMHEMARHASADLLREAERERLGRELDSAADKPRRWFRLLSRKRGLVRGRPVLGATRGD